MRIGQFPAFERLSDAIGVAVAWQLKDVSKLCLLGRLDIPKYAHTPILCL